MTRNDFLQALAQYLPGVSLTTAALITQDHRAVNGPHGAATDWVYTVPAGKILIVQTLACAIEPLTAPGAAGLAYARVEIVPTAGGTIYSILGANCGDAAIGNGKNDSMMGGLVLPTGWDIRGVSANAATGGTCYERSSMLAWEQDAP